MELTKQQLDKQHYPVLSFLDDLKISYQLFEHPPVFTVDEAKNLLAHILGHGTKNLFVRDKKKTTYALYTVREEVRVDLKTLGNQIGLGNVSFASPDDLRAKLHVEPGSVTPLAMLYADLLVLCYFDKTLLEFDLIQIHPMINTATIVLNPKDFCHGLLEKKGVMVRVI